MAREEDRAKIKLGPARFDTPKAIRDRIAETIQETPATALVGGVTIDDVQDAIDNYVPVTGGVGQVIGIPPGTPFVYVPANLAANPANLAGIGFAAYTFEGQLTNSIAQEVGSFGQDTANVLGLGVDTVMNASSSSLYAYNPSAGLAATLSFTALLASVNVPRRPFIADSSVVVGTGHGSAVTTPPARVYDGSAWSNITLTNPSTGNYWGMGPGTNTARICMISAASSTDAALVRVSEYSTAGGANIATNTFSVPTSISGTRSTGKVQNGWGIVLAQNGRFFVGPADATSTNTWKEFQVSGADLTIGEHSITIGASGIGFGSYRASGSNGLFKFDYNTNVLTLFAGVLDGVVTARPVNVSGTTRDVVSRGMSYANDNAGALTGNYTDPVSGFVSSVYLTFDTTGGSVSISALYFASNSTNLATFAYSPVVLASGQVTFVSNIVSPASRLLYQVAGP